MFTTFDSVSKPILAWYRSFKVTQRKLPKKYKFGGLPLISAKDMSHNINWDLYTKFESHMPSTFREKEFEPKMTNIAPKNTIMQIWQRFHVITGTSPLGISVLSFKWIWLVLLAKIHFWQKNGKKFPKITIMQISLQFEQTWLTSYLWSCIPNMKAVWLAVSEKKIFYQKWNIWSNLHIFGANPKKKKTSGHIPIMHLHTKYQVRRYCGSQDICVDGRLTSGHTYAIQTTPHSSRTIP